MIINKFDKKELASIANNLNCWNWDIRLGKKPEDFDNYRNWSENKLEKTKYTILKPIMKEIEARIGQKAILEDWHINHLGRTKWQFEIWWIKNKYSIKHNK